MSNQIIVSIIKDGLVADKQAFNEDQVSEVKSFLSKYGVDTGVHVLTASGTIHMSKPYWVKDGEGEFHIARPVFRNFSKMGDEHPFIIALKEWLGNQEPEIRYDTTQVVISYDDYHIRLEETCSGEWTVEEYLNGQLANYISLFDSRKQAVRWLMSWHKGIPASL